MPTPPAVAQQPAWSVDARVGLASPRGDLGDLHDDGFFAGGGVGRRLTRRLALHLEGGFESLERGGRPDRLGGTKGPPADLWHLQTLLVVEISEPEAGPWEVALGAGAGATFVRLGNSPRIAARTATWPTLLGMLQGGLELGTRWALLARIDLYFFREDQPEPEGYLSKEVDLVNTIGLRMAF